MMAQNTPEKEDSLIPKEAIKRSIEVRHPLKTGTPQRKNKDPFSEDRMAKNEPPNEAVLEEKPDDTVMPG